MSHSFGPWVGKIEEAGDCITERQTRQMAATLGLDPHMVTKTGVLPPLWHWMGWLNDTPMAGLGPDGHPAKGGFLPPVPLPRRMWAGGRLQFHHPLRIEEPLRRRSEILQISVKAGSAGDMVFVTVGHQIYGETGLAVEEQQDIVFMAMPAQFVLPAPVIAAPAPVWVQPEVMSTVRLFRYSALTFNAHRIHFDLPYAVDVEKYPGLVVHGPLQAMLLMAAACQRNPKAKVASFRFRGIRPLFQFDALRLLGWDVTDGSQTLATVIDGDVTCMQAQIGWQP